MKFSHRQVRSEYALPMFTNTFDQFKSKWCFMIPFFNQLKAVLRQRLARYEIESIISEGKTNFTKYRQVIKELKGLRNHWAAIYRHFDLAPTFSSYCNIHLFMGRRHSLSAYQCQHFVQSFRNDAIDEMHQLTGLQGMELIRNWRKLGLPTSLHTEVACTVDY